MISTVHLKNVIATGKAGTGKSTLAEILQRKYGYQKYSLASPIKEIASQMNEWNLDFLSRILYDAFCACFSRNGHYSLQDIQAVLTQAYRQFGPVLKERKKPRALYQFIGQEMRRVVHPDCWVRLLAWRIDYRVPFVIDDVRMPNEFQYFSAIPNTVSIRMVVPDEIRIQRLLLRDGVVDEEELNHETEKYCDDLRCTITVVNTGSLEDLEATVDELVREVMAARGVVVGEENGLLSEAGYEVVVG